MEAHDGVSEVATTAFCGYDILTADYADNTDSARCIPCIPRFRCVKR